MNTLQDALDIFNSHATRLGLLEKHTPMVSEPVLGKHENVVSVYVESLYPTVMTEFNIGPVRYIRELKLEKTKLKERILYGKHDVLDLQYLENQYLEVKKAIAVVYGVMTNPNSPYYDEMSANLLIKHVNQVRGNVMCVANLLMPNSVIYADVDTIFIKMDGSLTPNELTGKLTDVLNRYTPAIGSVMHPKFKVSVDKQYLDIEFTGKNKYTGTVKS